MNERQIIDFMKQAYGFENDIPLFDMVQLAYKEYLDTESKLTIANAKLEAQEAAIEIYKDALVGKY